MKRLLALILLSCSLAFPQSYKSATGFDYDSLGTNPTGAIGSQIRTYFKSGVGHPNLYGLWRGTVFQIGGGTGSFNWKLQSGLRDADSIVFKTGYALVFTKSGDTLTIGADTTILQLAGKRFGWKLTSGLPLDRDSLIVQAGTNITVTRVGDTLKISSGVGVSNIDQSGYFCDGSDGDSTLTGNITLTRDYYPRKLTIPVGDTLYTGGFRLCVKDTLTVNGVIDNSGKSAITGDTTGQNDVVWKCQVINQTCPASGASAAGNTSTTYFPDMGTSASTACTGGTDGGSITAGIVAKGDSGGTGGRGGDREICTGGQVGWSAGGGGAYTALSVTAGGVNNFYAIYTGRVVLANGTVSIFRASSGAGHGGAGGGGAQGTISGSATCYKNIAGAGGAGGGAGGNGGWVWVSGKHILGAGKIRADGGNGANGNKGGNADSCTPPTGIMSSGSGGGGGGGGGGSGGIVGVFYSELSGSITISASAGLGGFGGIAGLYPTGSIACMTAGHKAEAGRNGQNGNAGKIFKFQL